MALVVRLLYRELSDFSDKCYSDKRVANIPLVGSPILPIILVTSYLLFVTKWGPKWMADRKPYNVKPLIQIHNILQVFLNFYALYLGLPTSYFGKDFSWTCQNIDYNDTSPAKMQLLRAVTVYYYTKYLDLFDTVFFVLRKKNSQASFLHIYHHAIMVLGVWAYVTFIFGGHATMLGVFNSFVHCIMYGYYFASSINLKTDLTPWKKRITRLQIFQFFYLAVHFAMPVVNNWCNLNHNGLNTFAVIQNVFMACMFIDFYYKAYVKKGKNKQKKLN